MILPEFSGGCEATGRQDRSG